jgi:hypothetical protein
MWYEFSLLMLGTVAVFLNNIMSHLFSKEAGHFFEKLNHRQL